MDEGPGSFEPQMRWLSATWQPVDEALFCPVAVASAEQRIALFARTENWSIADGRTEAGPNRVRLECRWAAAARAPLRSRSIGSWQAVAPAKVLFTSSD